MTTEPLSGRLDAGERHRILVAFNDTARPYDATLTLIDLCHAQARATPQATALAWETPDGDYRSYTYAELHARADALAARLARAGLGTGSAVGVCLPRCADFLVAVLAVLKIGGYYVPFDPEYPLDRIVYMIQDSQVPVILSNAASAPALEAGGPAVLFVDEAPLETPGEAPVFTAARAEDFAYMIYTSGSTGRPKGAPNRHRGIVNRLLWMQERFAATTSDVVLQKTSFSFDVSVWEMFWPLTSGAQLLLAKPEGHRDAEYLVEFIQRRGVTFAHFVPSMLRFFAVAAGVENCTTLKHVMCSGEALPGDLVRQFYARSRAELHNLYGPTEASVEVTHFVCPRDWTQATVPIGRPIANTKIYLLDADLRPVPVNVRGELYIGGVQVGAGYFRRPELTAEKFVPDVFSDDPDARLYRSGDLALYDDTGTIYFSGRIDSQVKINGVRIEPGEVETQIRALDDVRDAAVVVRSAENDDPYLVAYVVMREGGRSKDELQSHLATMMPAFLMPVVCPIAMLPLTPNGKLDYRALPDPTEYVTAAADLGSNILYHEIAEMWQDALGVTSIGINDNFFVIGGRSITAARLIAQMSQRFGRRLTSARFFENPTIAHVAELLLADMREEHSPAIEALNPTGALTPFYYFDGDMNGGGHYVRNFARRLGDDRPLYVMHMPGLNGTPIPATVDEMARIYADLIQAERPTGPYILGGYCNGSLIAHEMMRVLKARGQVVEKLIFVEATGENGRLTIPMGIVDDVLRSLRVPSPVRFRLRRLVGSAFGRLESYKIKLKLSDEQRKAWLRRFVSPSRWWFYVSGAAADDAGVAWVGRSNGFIPRRDPCPIHLLMSEGTLAEGRRTFWHRVSDDVTLETVPGEHINCLTRHVDALAIAIDRRLSA